MKSADRYSYELVDFIPEALEPHVLYVSVEYATTCHLCMCGCESRVVAPLGRREWKLVFDGETVSLYPSIGNWSLPCRAHYILRDGKVRWARNWSDAEVAANRAYDDRVKATVEPPDDSCALDDGTAEREHL
jgi:hypothetical protein